MTTEVPAMMRDERNTNHDLSTKRAGRHCHACASGDTTLNVHHRLDERHGQSDHRRPIVLCEPCRGVFLAYGKLVSPA
jgi:hypothetical protein